MKSSVYNIQVLFGLVVGIPGFHLGRTPGVETVSCCSVIIL